MQTYGCSGREDRSVTGQMRTYPESHCIIQGKLERGLKHGLKSTLSNKRWQFNSSFHHRCGVIDAQQ